MYENMNRRDFLKSSAATPALAAGLHELPKDDSNRRLKILQCDPHLVVMVLNWQRNPTSAICITDAPQIPNDVEIVSVYANWESRSMDVMVRHPSFDVVPVGAKPPVDSNWHHPQMVCRVDHSITFPSAEPVTGNVST